MAAILKRTEIKQLLEGRHDTTEGIAHLHSEEEMNCNCSQVSQVNRSLWECGCYLSCYSVTYQDNVRERRGRKFKH